MSNIENKTIIALERIRKAFDNNGRVISGHSGGKDSVVINDLITKAGCDSRRYAIVHNVKPLLGTSGDPVAALTEMHPATLEFLYTNVCLEQTLTFLHASKMKNWVTNNHITCQIDGSRLCEYTRSGKSSEFIVNGKSVSRSEMTEYIENGIFGLNMSYPIFDWSDTDVFDYIALNDLKISNEYYLNGEYDAWLFNRNSSSAC